jgi:hypothetical protein
VKAISPREELAPAIRVNDCVICVASCGKAIELGRELVTPVTPEGRMRARLKVVGSAFVVEPVARLTVKAYEAELAPRSTVTSDGVTATP